MATTTSPTRELIVRFTMAAAFLAWTAYALHGTVDGQGLIGWLDDTSLRLFGSASTSTSLLAAMVIGFAPIGLAFRLIGRALGVTIAPRRAGRPIGSPRHILVRSILGGVAALAGAALLIGIVLPDGDGLHIAVPVGSGEPARLDLDATPGAAPSGTPRVALIGTPQEQLTAGYRETNDHDESTIYRYLPLTGRTWHAGDPVRFLLAEVQRSDEPQPRGIVAGGEPDGRLRFTGKLRRNGLPVIARSALEHKGVVLADPYWVVYNHDDQTFFLVILIGTFGFAIALGLLTTGVRDARIARRAVAGRTAG